MPALRSIDADADAARGKVTFARDTGFHGEVKRRVLAYFERTGLSQRDSPRMYLKTAVLLLWFGVSYGLLVFVATTFWQGALLSSSLALAMAGIGFGIQHDANHGAYSSRAAVNRVMGLTLDMLGASSYLWRFKHNLSHHTYTNLAGADDDINFVPFARLSPAQPRYRLHRLQQFYLWALYWFLFPKWNFVDDFKTLMRARISGHGFPRPRGASAVELVAGKAVFVAWAFAIPLLFHPWWVVLLFYGATSLLLGTTLAVVFMLAHCVEEAELPGGAVRGGAAVAPLGGAPGRDHRRLRARQSAADLVRGRAQLPDRAPPVPAHLPRPLPAHRGDRAGDVRRVRRPLRRPRHVPRRPRLSLALATPHGKHARADSRGLSARARRETSVDVPPSARAIAVVLAVGVVRCGCGCHSRPDVQGGGSLAGNEPQPASSTRSSSVRSGWLPGGAGGP